MELDGRRPARHRAAAAAAAAGAAAAAAHGAAAAAVGAAGAAGGQARIQERASPGRPGPDVLAALLKPVQQLGVAEREGRFQPRALPDLGKVQHGIDQARPVAGRDVAGLGSERRPGGPAGSAAGDDIGRSDRSVIVLDLDVLITVVLGHALPPGRIHMDAGVSEARPRKKTRFNQPPAISLGAHLDTARSLASRVPRRPGAQNRLRPLFIWVHLRRPHGPQRPSIPAGVARRSGRRWLIKLNGTAREPQRLPGRSVWAGNVAPRGPATPGPWSVSGAWRATSR